MSIFYNIVGILILTHANFSYVNFRFLNNWRHSLLHRYSHIEKSSTNIVQYPTFNETWDSGEVPWDIHNNSSANSITL